MIWSLKKVWLSWKLALSSECSYLLLATIRTYIPKQTSMWTCFRICFWLFQDCVTDKCLKLSCWAIASPSYYCSNTPRTEEHPWTLMKLPLAPLLLVFFPYQLGISIFESKNHRQISFIFQSIHPCFLYKSDITLTLWKMLSCLTLLHLPWHLRSLSKGLGNLAQEG